MLHGDLQDDWNMNSDRNYIYKIFSEALNWNSET